VNGKVDIKSLAHAGGYKLAEPFPKNLSVQISLLTFSVSIFCQS